MSTNAKTPERSKIVKFDIKQISTILTSSLVILGVAGYVAKPHAEQFIQQSVQNKVDTLDIKLRHVERILKENTDSQRNIQIEQRVLIEQQKLIIDLIKQKETDQ